MKPMTPKFGWLPDLNYLIFGLRGVVVYKGLIFPALKTG
jgi:hypothetical protein